MNENLQMFFWYIVVMGILAYVFTGIDKIRPLDRVILWLAIVCAWPLVILWVVGGAAKDFGKELREDIKLRLDGK